MQPHATTGPEPSDGAGRAAVEALGQAIYYLDRSLAPAQKVRAFQRAIEVVDGLDEDELSSRAATNTLTELAGIGASTGAVIGAAVNDLPNDYLDELDRATRIDPGAGAELLAALRGDAHMHTRWSDGSVDIEQMARTAADLGHEWIVITDHSPRLTVAHGLQPERLDAQLDEIAVLNERGDLPRILTGMEVDILEDGSLDMSPDRLDRLDLVVASVHSKLSMPADEMTRRMVLAVSSPLVDVLGHCTGRKLVGRGRPPSRFGADVVFAACARFGTAVEINCRPERQDPPEELLALALDWGCDIAINTDAHAPGQMEWQAFGATKAVSSGIEPHRILNTLSADELIDRVGSPAA